MFCPNCHTLLSSEHRCIEQKKPDSERERLLRKLKAIPKLEKIIRDTRMPGESEQDWLQRYLEKTKNNLYYVIVSCTHKKVGVVHIKTLAQALSYFGRDFNFNSSKVFCAADCSDCTFTVHQTYDEKLQMFEKWGAPYDDLDQYVLIVLKQILYSPKDTKTFNALTAKK